MESTKEVTHSDLRGKSHETLTIPVRFFSRVSTQAWYSADPHLHLRYLFIPEASRYLSEIPAADHLDLVFISYLERLGAHQDYVTNHYPIGTLPERWPAGVIISSGEEHRHDFGAFHEGYGHVMLLNLKSHVLPVGAAINGKGFDLPPLQDGMREAHRQGGKAIWCHGA